MNRILEGILAGGMLVAVGLLVPAAVLAQDFSSPTREFDRAEPPASVRPGGLEVVDRGDWTVSSVRRVLQAFAFGGHATDAQIGQWARMPPEAAIRQMLNFDAVNRRLSAPDERTSESGCTSITELQQLWGSDDPANPVRQFDRDYYAMLFEDQQQLSQVGLYLT